MVWNGHGVLGSVVFQRYSYNFPKQKAKKCKTLQFQTIFLLYLVCNRKQNNKINKIIHKYNEIYV